MTIDELAVLLPQVQDLIEGYEKGARKAISTSSPKEISKIALSLHISPMRTMRLAMNTMDSASLTPKEMENEYKSQNTASQNNEKIEPTKEILKDKYFDQDCEIIGGDAWFDKEKIKEENVRLGGIEIPKKKGTKYTNPVKVTVNVNPLFPFPFEEQRSGRTTADCYNCEVNYTSEIMYPSLEVMWEFEKLLNQLLNAIKIIKNNLDPTLIYKDICNIKAFVGKNLFCPSMLIKINLMLPTLFMKYSMDLGKISADANFVLGGILKIAISAIVAFLENVRALIIPLIDCVLNGAKVISGYVKSVAQAISKSVDEVGGLVDRTAQVAHKGALVVGEVFSGDPTGIKAKENLTNAELKQVKEEYEKTKEEYAEIIDKLKNFEPASTDLSRETKDTAYIISTSSMIYQSDILYDSLPEEYGGSYKGSFKDNPLIKDLKEYFLYRYANQETFFAPMEFEALNPQQFQALLIDYLNYYYSEKDIIKGHESMVFTRYLFGSSSQEASRGGPSTIVGDLTRELRDPYIKERDELEVKVDLLERRIDYLTEVLELEKKERHEENKGSLAYKMLNRDKKILEYSKMARMEQPQENKDILRKWLSTRYSFNLENSYVEHEYYATRKAKAGLKYISSDPLNKIGNLIDNWIVKYLEIAKKYVNDFFGNTINALKNLNIILEQNTFSQFRILGEILQLTHIIRAFYLIEKLIEEGFEGCDKIEEDKAQEKMLKDAIEAASEEKVKAEVITKENSELGSQEQYLKIFAKRGKYSHLSSLKDCSDATSYLEKADVNLDLIYNSMKEELI